MTNLSDQIESAKSKVTEPFPSPPDMEGKQSTPDELLQRLNWGEPALTIIDIRSREAFNEERITGAVPIPMEQIPEDAQSMLEQNRDIYIYGDSSETTAEAANRLRQAGYEKVSELHGGLSGWKAVGGPTEGIYAFSSPAKSAEASANT